MTDRIIRIRLDASDATRGINQVDSQMERLDGTTNRVNTSMTRLAAAVASALSVQKLAAYADQWKDLESRFRNAVGEGENAADVLSRINDIANSSFSSLQNTSEAFLLNARSLQELNFSTQQQLDLTESLSLALVVSGAKQQRAESVTVAFSKAIAAGTLRGENFNTIIQSGGEVAAALADGLGVTTIELRKMAEEGLLTADKVVPALTSQLEILRKKADEMPATIGDAFLILNNKALEYVGTLDKTVGASEKVSDSILFFASNLETVANGIALIAAVIGGRWLGALTASTIALVAKSQAALAAKVTTDALGVAISRTTVAANVGTVAIRGLGASMAFLGGPVGVIALVAASFLLFSNNAAVAKTESDILASTNDLLSQSYDNLTEAQTRNTRFQLTQKIAALRIEQEELRKSRELTQGLTADELALAAAFTGTKGSLEQFGNAADASQSKVDELEQQIEKLNGRLSELPDVAQKGGAALNSLSDSLSALRAVSSGLDRIFTGEFNLFGDADTSAQDDQTAARINARIEGLRLETQTISSEAAMQAAIRQQVFTAEEAQLANQTAARILSAISERELLLAEDAITSEQQLAAETAFQEQLTAIDQLYSEQRLELQRQVNLEKQAIEQQTQQTYLDTASIALDALSSLVGGSSKAGKALKLVQAGVNAFQVFAASQAAAALVLATPPGPVLNPSLGPLAASIVAKGKVSAAAIMAGAAATTFSGGGGGGFSGLSSGPSSQALPTTPQGAAQVGAIEIVGFSEVIDELRAQDGMVSTMFVAKLLDKVQDANRLRGEG